MSHMTHLIGERQPENLKKDLAMYCKAVQLWIGRQAGANSETIQ